jgi:RNA polymerase sigma-70 factor (ECF subfamily)
MSEPSPPAAAPVDPLRDNTALAKLIDAARGGSRQALGELAEACRRYLLLIANLEVPAEFQAKVSPSDLVQETFLRAQQDFGHFRGRSRHELLGWLRRILLNSLADAYRRYDQSGNRQARRELPLEVSDTDSQKGFDVPAGWTSPSSQLAGQEEKAAVERALAQLPEQYREVILLCHRDGLSFDEAARRMDRSVGAVRKLWVRAIDHLQRGLEARDG